MSELYEPLLIGSVAGLAGGLALLIRGMGAYRTAGRIADTAGSTVASAAVGEIRLTGEVEPAEFVLISPLQSEQCVYYKASVDEHEDRTEARVLREERAVGFRIRDASGSMRVFPRGARWAVPDVFKAGTDMFGNQPAGLNIRDGPMEVAAVVERDQAIEALLTVKEPPRDDPGLTKLLAGGRSRSYREARVSPGDTITLVGFAEPFDQLPDPTGANEAWGSSLDGDGAIGDAAVAADLAEAREQGLLADRPEDAWGNAAIPGFGIGRPTRAPQLDPAARPLPLAEATEAARYEQSFSIAPNELVIAAAPDVPLLITLGAPGAAAARESERFVIGLLGAVVAIASAVTLALVAAGSLP